MATKEELKAVFITGAVPTEANFHDLIDVAGEKGDTGAKGDKGEPGAVGAKGDKGDTGAKGAKGDTGEQGPQGDAGAKGAKGDTGAQGPAGADGADGFPTEEQWNELVARVDALETPEA